MNEKSDDGKTQSRLSEQLWARTLEGLNSRLRDSGLTVTDNTGKSAGPKEPLVVSFRPKSTDESPKTEMVPKQTTNSDDPAPLIASSPQKKKRKSPKPKNVPEKKNPYEIITHKSDPQRIHQLSGDLTHYGELWCGGLTETSSWVGMAGLKACVYWLEWSEDQRLYGLRVNDYTPIPENNTADEEPYDGSLYTWALDHCKCKDSIGAIAILAEGVNVTREEVARALEDAYIDDGGVPITDIRCP